MGFKPMLCGVFHHWDLKFFDDGVAAAIIRACCHGVRRSGPEVPALNVDVVIQALHFPPFQP